MQARWRQLEREDEQEKPKEVYPQFFPSSVSPFPSWKSLNIQSLLNYFFFFPLYLSTTHPPPFVSSLLPVELEQFRYPRSVAFLCPYLEAPNMLHISSISWGIFVSRMLAEVAVSLRNKINTSVASLVDTEMSVCIWSETSST